MDHHPADPTGADADADPDPDKKRTEPTDRGHPGRRGHHVVLWIALVAVIAGLTGGAAWLRSVEPAEPDAFYTPPSPLPDVPAGTVIRTEPLGQDVPGGGTATKVLYITSDPDGSPRAASAVVYVPPGDAPPGGRDVVAWSHPTTGVVPRCAPSLRSDVGATIPGLESLLDAGYVVVATDYPGLGTPAPHWYLVGEAEARAVIDSVRVAGDLLDGATSDRYVAWGHSQGGQSVLFTGQIAPTFAPELELLGVVATAPAAELARILERDLPTIPGRVLGSQALTAWSWVYPDAEITDLVSEDEAERIEAIAEGCIETTSQLLVLLPRVLALGEDWVTFDEVMVEPWTTYIAENTPGAVTIEAPVLLTQGLDDQIVWADLNMDWARRACADGTSIEVVTLPGVGHDGAGQASADAAVPWIVQRFDGDPAPDGCDDIPDLPAPGDAKMPSGDGEDADPDNDLTTGE